MAIFIGIGILYYVASWCHAIMRFKTGGKPGSRYDFYCCDENVPADKWSASGIVYGTLIIIAVWLTLR